MAASMKMVVFWVVVSCSLVEVHQRSRGTSCLHHQGNEALMTEAASTSETSVTFGGTCCLIALMMEAVSTSETLVNFYRTARRHNPHDSHLSICEPLQANLNVQINKNKSKLTKRYSHFYMVLQANYFLHI
jgi:hypothetical protein